MTLPWNISFGLCHIIYIYMAGQGLHHYAVFTEVSMHVTKTKENKGLMASLTFSRLISMRTSMDYSSLEVDP